MKLSETQQKALDVVQELVKEEKITLQQAFDLITAIYETEKEYVYVPQTAPLEPYRPRTTEPWIYPNTPWYQQYITTCRQDTVNNANSTNNTNPKVIGCTWAPGQYDYLYDGWQGSITH